MMANDHAHGDDHAKRDAATRLLVKKHFEIEPGVTRIFRLATGEAEASGVAPIRLLEVNEATAPSGIMPLHFGPAPAAGIPYPSTIVEVTPEEFEKIKTEELKLPEGWSLGEEFPKPAEDTRGA